MKQKSRIIGAISIILLLVGSIFFFQTDVDHTITPEEMTHTAIGETFYRVSIYMRSNNSIPKSLNDLPVREGFMNTTIDGWGHHLQYTISADGVLTLTSFGKDGEPGGANDNADISRSYRTKDAEGMLIISDPEWIDRAEIQ